MKFDNMRLIKPSVVFLGYVISPVEVFRYCDPKYLAADTLSSSMLCRKYLNRMRDLILVTCRT